MDFFARNCIQTPEDSSVEAWRTKVHIRRFEDLYDKSKHVYMLIGSLIVRTHTTIQYMYRVAGK